MSNKNLLCRIARELGLNFNEDSMQAMIELLENDVSPDGLVRILEEAKVELQKLG